MVLWYSIVNPFSTTTREFSLQHPIKNPRQDIVVLESRQQARRQAVCYFVEDQCRQLKPAQRSHFRLPRAALPLLAVFSRGPYAPALQLPI